MDRGPLAEFVQAVPVMGPTFANWLTIGQGIESFFTPNPLAFAGVHLPLGTESGLLQHRAAGSERFPNWSISRGSPSRSRG